MPYRRLSALIAATTLAACAPGASDYEDPFVATGEGDGAETPRIAGLDEGYMLKQLNDYGAGLRPHDQMSPIARRLSDADRARVARYYARMPARTAASAVPPRAALIAEGRTIYHQGLPGQGVATCAACHGADGQGVGSANPPLTGQPPAYLAAQLRLWKNRDRRNDPLDAMGAVVRPLSERQIEAVSAYAASLPHPSPE